MKRVTSGPGACRSGSRAVDSSRSACDRWTRCLHCRRMDIDLDLLRRSWRSWISSEGNPDTPRWLQWLWTLLFALALAALFTVLGMISFSGRDGGWPSLSRWASWFGRNFVVCLTISALIHLLFDLLEPWACRRQAAWAAWQRMGYYAGIPLFGVVVGWPLGLVLAGADLQTWLGTTQGLRAALWSLVLALVVTFVLHHVFATKARQYDAERQASEARLRLLQAQIEPHFLFNTLANVAGLIDSDAARARHMLESFTEYLRASFSGLRRDRAPLADELALAQAYLKVQQARMEDRLRFSIDADEVCRRQNLPPLLLQPLVENAVLHGIEPAVDGGQVRVRALQQGAQLLIEVHDDGLGPGGSGRQGHGLALENLRQRLESTWGRAASLELVDGRPGTLARLRIPIDPATPGLERGT